MRTWRTLCCVALLAALAALATGAPVPAADDANLLANPGAEDGTEAPLEEGHLPPPRGWAATNEFTVRSYGDLGLPDAADSQAISGGSRLFTGGRCAGPPLCETSSAQQDLDVSANAAAIDAGSVRAELSAALGGRDAERDAGRVRAQFLGAASERLGQVEIGPVTAEDRAGETLLERRSGSATVPAGTRRIRVALLADGGDGEEVDAYFDNVVLRLPGASAPVTPVDPGGGGSGDGSGGGPGGGDAGGGSGSPAPVRLSARPVRMSRSGVVLARVRCARTDAACAGTLTLTARSRRCGSRRARVAAGRTARVPLRLGRRCRGLVRRSRRGLPATLAYRDGSGASARVSIVVRRPV